MQFFLIGYLMVVQKCFILIGIATLPMIFTLTKDMKCDLNAIQQSLKDKQKRSDMAKPMTQFIQFHSNARQLSVKFHTQGIFAHFS